jgi:trehalose synthase
MIVQVSRWDPLKDMAGVMRAFASEPRTQHAALVLAGPDVTSVTDDPEGQQVLADVTEQLRRLPHDVRSRISIVSLPMDDPEENATMVNALQRHATVIVQKSLKEGFGLTVTEAMFKGRPVIASAVGGIVDQIRDGVDGLLIADATDTRAAGAAMGVLLRDHFEADRLGREGHKVVVEEFLADSSLALWARTLEAIMSHPRRRPE